MRSVRLLTVLVLALAVSCTAARAQEQSGTGDSVADAARKARQQKKTAPKPRKVLTDDDVAALPAAQTPTPASQTNPEPAPAANPEAAPAEVAAQKEDPHSEKAWRKRFAAQRKKIADAELELDVLQREAQKADVQYYSDPQKAMQEQFSREEINKKNAAIEAKKKQIADLKQQLSDMEDELRASGGEPGWAR